MNGTLRRRVALAGEAGFGLIEVLVAAVVVVLIATATVTAIATSQKQSARNLARSVTANLAEQDQERMKAMAVTDLVNYSASRTVLQEGVSYKVDSVTEFAQGPNGSTVSCTSTGQQSRLLRLRTTVTPQVGLEADPLVVESLHPLPIADFSPTSGTLIAKIVKADGTTPQPGIPVSIAGPESRTLNTNDAGCSVFQFLRPGSYTGSVDTMGYVDPSLNQHVDMSGTVTAGTINPMTTIYYDLAGSIAASFNTLGNTTHAGPGITLTNSGLVPSGTSKYFAGRTAAGLFPFPGPYTGFSSVSASCLKNDPSQWEPTFYVDHPDYGRATVGAGVNGVQMLMREPPLSVAVAITGPNGATYANRVLYAKQTDTGCAYSYPSVALTANSSTVTSQLPYGTYRICVETDRSGSGANATFSTVKTVTNGVFAGTATSLPLDTSATATVKAKCAANAAWLA